MWLARALGHRRRCKAWGGGEWRVVAERGSVDEGVVLAARTIGALCMRAESIVHVFSAICLKDRPTCLLRHPDNLAVASRRVGALRVRLCDREGLRRRWHLRHGPLWYGMSKLEKRRTRKRYEGSVTAD